MCFLCVFLYLVVVFTCCVSVKLILEDVSQIRYSAASVRFPTCSSVVHPPQLLQMMQWSLFWTCFQGFIKSWWIIAFVVEGSPSGGFHSQKHILWQKGEFSSLRGSTQAKGGRCHPTSHPVAVCAVPQGWVQAWSQPLFRGTSLQDGSEPRGFSSSSCSSEVWALFFLSMIKGQSFLFKEFIPQNH